MIGGGKFTDICMSGIPLHLNPDGLMEKYGLMKRMSDGGKGHVVHLDNLFTSSKLLSTRRDYGIGANGTVRTGRTKRGENEERNYEEDVECLEPAQVRDQEPNLWPAVDLVEEIRFLPVVPGLGWFKAFNISRPPVALKGW
jgi:hypothetical protein